MIKKALPEADNLGYWGFVMPDHYMWGPDRGGDSTLETWSALTYLAARTEKIRLGTLVTPIPFRPPGMLAKQVSTLDLISDGRTLFGVGAGWSETEFVGYSQWDPPKIRVAKTQEGVELILKLWTTEGKVNFNGLYYRATNTVLDPKPIQKPYPTLLFGGVGKRMLEMAGRYSDICAIPPWVPLGFDKAKEIVLTSAKKYSREDKVSFAQISWGFGERYDYKVWMNKVLQTKQAGCEYSIIGFPRESFLESMTDFVVNVIPSV